MNKFKVIIAGGRDFKDYEELRKFCDTILQNKENIEIVSGTAKGADLLGEKYALEKGYELTKFLVDWNDIRNKPEKQIGYRVDGTPYWKLAGHDRNRKMGEYSDALISFWNGYSRGTKNMIDIAKKKKLMFRIYYY